MWSRVRFSHPAPTTPCKFKGSLHRVTSRFAVWWFIRWFIAKNLCIRANAQGTRSSCPPLVFTLWNVEYHNEFWADLGLLRSTRPRNLFHQQFRRRGRDEPRPNKGPFGIRTANRAGIHRFHQTPSLNLSLLLLLRYIEFIAWPTATSVIRPVSAVDLASEHHRLAPRFR